MLWSWSQCSTYTHHHHHIADPPRESIVDESLTQSHCHDDSVIATKNQTIRTKVLNMIPLPRRIVPVLQKIKLNKTTKTTTTSNQSQRCSQESENKNSLAQHRFLACHITLKAGVCRRDFADMRLDHQEFATSLSDSVSYRNYNTLTFPY